MILRKERFSIVAMMTYACLLVMLASVALARPKHMPGSKNHHNTAGMNPSGMAFGFHKNSSLKFHGPKSTTGPTGPAVSSGVMKGNGPKFSAMPACGAGSSGANHTAKPGCQGPVSGSPCTPTFVSNGIFVKTHPGKSLGHLKHGFAGTSCGKGKFVLGAGDAFSSACDFGGMSGSIVPNPIGAKGPNPVHGGQHPKKGFGNPGGGNCNGHWGEGNHGNGKGNIWCGNQGHGVGEGMAGGCGKHHWKHKKCKHKHHWWKRCRRRCRRKCKPHEEEVLAVVEAAPLWLKPELEFSGCPALLQWAASELGAPEGQLQIYMKNTLASPTDIQPCDVCAQLQTAALILKDIQGRRISALTTVINEAVVPDAPITPEQMAVIATALADAEQGSQYASASEYIDAALSYVNILTSEFGLTTEESLDLISKYVVTIEDEAAANYVLVRLVQL